MKVAELMQNDPLLVGPDETIGKIAKAMTDTKGRAAVVIESERIVGIVTAHDLLAKHATLHFPKYFSLLGYSIPIEPGADGLEIQKALATTVRDVMTSPTITIGPDDEVDQAATMMVDENISCIPVSQDGRLLGIIDEGDIVRLLAVEESE